MKQLLLTPLEGPQAGCPTPLVEGVLGRGLVADPTASRKQVQVRRVRSTFRAHALARHNLPRVLFGRWWLSKRSFRIHPGTCFQLGQTRVRVCARPNDLRYRKPQLRQRELNRAIFFLPLLVMPLFLFRTFAANWLLLGVLAAITAAVGGIGIYKWRVQIRQKLPLPTPWGLYLRAQSVQAPSTHSGPLVAWISDPKKGEILKVEPGECVYLVGRHSSANLWWWLAQCGAEISAGEDCYKVSWKDGEATLAAVSDEGEVPAAATRIVLIDSPVGVSHSWFANFLNSGAKMPEVVLTEMPAETVKGTLWQHPSNRVQIGQDTSGPVFLDLADGPHALVAGTTGAGKSEALTTWLLQLALAAPPWQLNFILVDYKGGAAFGPLEGLPHVAGMLTNLDSGATERALSSLMAELKRRERAQAQGEAPGPRLVIVVDEFRELALTHPKILEDLTRIAALGRSLGVSLVLATQRPGGVVDSHIRANASIRLCLRVLEATDSMDVLGDATAASLPAIPGRAILEAAGSRRDVQISWTKPEVAMAIVRRIQAATDFVASAPWAPELPRALPLCEAAAGGGSGSVLGEADYPDRQCTDSFCLPTLGKILLCGPTRMGATTAAKTLACQVVGRPVHVFTSRPSEWKGATTVIDAPCLQAQGLSLLLAGQSAGALVIIDGIEALLANLDLSEGTGIGLELLEQLCRMDGIDLVVTVRPAQTGARWCANFSTRIYLGLTDPLDIARVGLKAKDAAQLKNPGRALVVTQEKTVVQIALPEALSAAGMPLVSTLPQPGTIAGVGIGWQGPLGTPWVPSPGRWLIAGPAGSGKSTLCSALARALAIEPEQVIDSAKGSRPPITDSTTLLTCSITELTTAFSGPLSDYAANAKIVVLAPNSAIRSWARDYDLTGMLPLPGQTKPGRGIYFDGAEAKVIQTTARTAL